jgi:predicted TIM-barrel enzyme
MEISLPGGRKYKFVCSLVKNGKNTLYFTNTATGYSASFQNQGGSTVLGIRFITGGSYRLTGLESSVALLKTGSSNIPPA